MFHGTNIILCNKVRLTFVCFDYFQAIVAFRAKRKKITLQCRMLTGKSRILPATFCSDTVSGSRIRRQCLVELKEEPVPVSEDFGSISVLMKYFPVHGPANKERSRSFEGSTHHKKTEPKYPIG